ncbi:MAG: hypothetical protein EPO16_08430 [Dehalococcoidia bacterium]|nr:MAG: hypothetical protein EPO16_08430 [Dehalococcoidia bacterium]
MSTGARATLAVAVLGGVAFPLAFAHMLAPAVASHSGAAPHLGAHLDLIPLSVLGAVSLLPLIGLGRGAVRWIVAERCLTALTRQGLPQSSGGVRYVSVPGTQVALFTAGLRQPVIYATAGAEQTLDAGALHAALLHERAHMSHHDVRWLALVSLAEAAVGAFPGARRLFSSLRIEMEWRADSAALAAGARREDLFEAIVGAAGVAAGGAALSGVGTAERLAWLAQPETPPLVSERQAAPVFAGLFGLPLLAHALIWTGIFCVACPHLG